MKKLLKEIQLEILLLKKKLKKREDQEKKKKLLKKKNILKKLLVFHLMISWSLKQLPQARNKQEKQKESKELKLKQIHWPKIKLKQNFKTNTWSNHLLKLLIRVQWILDSKLKLKKKPQKLEEVEEVAEVAETKIEEMLKLKEEEESQTLRNNWLWLRMISQLYEKIDYILINRKSFWSIKIECLEITNLSNKLHKSLKIYEQFFIQLSSFF